MNWTELISSSIKYIEDHILEKIGIEDIAKQVHISPFYFQKGFALLCGLTVSEYIRKRRLALAGNELVSTNIRIIDLALKYGYDSPDSFSKAFTRFHGITPALAKKDGSLLKSFSPLKIQLSMKGGTLMDYKIVEKESFTVIGASKIFKYDNADIEVPNFCSQHYSSGNGQFISGMYGISYDEEMDGNKFEYLIADDYDSEKEIPQEFVKKIIPAYTWAIFPCKGSMPESLEKVNNQIFSEWLPACKEYEIAAGYNINYYDDPTKYLNGTQDINYYCEIWIPVSKK